MLNLNTCKQQYYFVVLGLSARIGTLPAARSDTHGTSSRCTVRGTVPCRAVGSVLASHCRMSTVDFELILCRQVGDKFLFVIELFGFPAIHQSTVGTISDCVYLCVCGRVSALRKGYLGEGGGGI